jgi:hypothetical protein
MDGQLTRAIACTLLVVAGCWRGGAETEAEQPTRRRVKGATCEQVSGNVHAVVANAEDKELAARAGALRDVVQRRCAADAWSIELRRCVASATTVDDARTCDNLATQQQRDAFADDVEVMIVSEDGQ